MNFSSPRQNQSINLISNIILFLSVISFLAFYLVLSYNNRPAYDDLAGIYFTKGNTLFQYVNGLFTSLSGRWISWVYFYTVIAAANSFNAIHYYFFVYYFITLLIFLYSINKIIKSSIFRLFNVNMNHTLTLIYSILFLATFYFFTFQNIETWWYIGASFMYLQGIVFLLLGVALILEERKNILHYILISISFIYVGSCYEIYSLIVGFLFITFIIYFLYKNKGRISAIKKHWFIKGFITAFISLSVFAVLCIFAPSNMERRKDYKEHFTEFYASSDLTQTISSFIDKKYLVALFISSLFLILGIRVKNNCFTTIDNERIKKIVVLFCITFIISIFITYLFQSIILYGILVPSRGWAFTSFSLAVLVCFMFFLVGYYISFSKLYSQFCINIFIPFFVLIVFALYLINQYNYTSNYSKKYDDLIDSFLKAKNNNSKEPFYMEKLPESGMLMQLDMEDDSHNPAYLKSILGLNYEIIVKK